MSYEKTVWADGSTALSAEHMNNIEDGIEALDIGKVDKVSGKGLSESDYTTAEKGKLAGIATGAEVNQNAFSNVKVGSTTVAADSKTDTLELVAGPNVTLTPDATNDKVTIAATDTTYSSKAAASGGTAVSLVTTGEKYTWNTKAGAAVNSLTSTSTTAALSAAQGKALNDNKAAKSDAIKNITRSGTTFTATKADGSTFTFTQQDNNTTYSNATTSAAGLMSAADKTKLNGIATGAQVNPGNATTSAAGLMSAADKVKLNNITTSAKDIKIKTFTADNITVNASSYYNNLVIAATEAGWTLIGVIGYQINNATNSGTGWTHCFLQKLYTSGDAVGGAIGNYHASNNAKVQITVTCLYIK